MRYYFAFLDDDVKVLYKVDKDSYISFVWSHGRVQEYKYFKENPQEFYNYKEISLKEFQKILIRWNFECKDYSIFQPYRVVYV